MSSSALDAAASPRSAAQNNPCVHVVSNTWARDSHDLYDFEAQQVCTKNFTVVQNSRCYRIGADVEVVSDQAAPVNGSEQLLRLIQKDGSFWVDRANNYSSKKLWLVVRDLPGSSKKLIEGDIIKLGRFKFRVRQLVASDCSGSVQPELRLDDNESCCIGGGDTAGELAQKVCRIRLMEGGSDEDPLLAPCKCKGSIEYVHLGCLRHWIKGRLDLSDSQASYFFRPLACELCKATYPTYVENGQDGRTPLVEVPRTQAPFIVLENLVRDSQVHSCRGLHVVSLADKTLKLGRGHESDVRIADVSISRCHATIQFANGQFLLKDNNSKFGTLVALKKPRPLQPSTVMSIQMGRTVLNLRLQLPTHIPNSPSVVLHHLGSRVEDERALRLSLLTRATRDEDFPDCGGLPSHFASE